MNNKDIVKKLIESKAIDFAAIAKVMAEVGPALAASEEPGDHFCGTGPHVIHLYRLFNNATVVEETQSLRAAAAGQLR